MNASLSVGYLESAYDSRVNTYPKVEEEVWNGPNAVIIGGVTVGFGSRITGSTIVAKDVQPHAIVPGYPEQEIKSNLLPDVVSSSGVYC
jgi:serine O-acetyltransferase